MAATLMPMSKKSPNMSEKKQLRLDPHRALEPVRKKLTTLETQRVMAVLDEGMKRIQIASALPSVVENKADFAILLGRDLVALIDEYALVMEDYDIVAAKMDAILGKKRKQEEVQDRAESVFSEDFFTRPRSAQSSKSSKSTSRYWDDFTPEQVQEMRQQREEIMDKIQEIIPRIEFAYRNVLRGFRANPTAITSLTSPEQRKDWRIEFSAGTNRTLEKLTLLRDIMMLRLMTTPAERDERMTFLRQVSERERANTVVVEKLEAELKTANEHKDEEIKKKNEVIRRLQADIHHIEKYSSENIKQIKSEADKQKASDEKNSEGKRQKLQQELNELRNKMNATVTEHRDSEENLRRKKWMLETEVDNLIQKFDIEMGDRQTEYEEVDDVYTEEKKQLHELEERFKTLSEEYNQIMEERRIAQEKREAAEREMQLLIGAATTIQSFWRSYKVRKNLRGKRRGKGKGGKGKGKKK